MIEHDPLIAEFSHEKFRPREAEALRALQKVASIVKPIMRQRGWKVGVLTEFWPPEKNLLGLNWNRGQKICLRLRYPFDEKQFLPLEDVVDTMLHELCHIVHGPHNEAFHTLWNQLRDEHESLVRKGYTGEGFLSTGHKLGGGRIPMHEARRRARAAAEQRRVLSAGSGQKLGGTGIRRGEDVRKVIADAAQRRLNVTRGCADDTERKTEIMEEVSRNGFRTKAEEDDANEQAIMQAYIELIQEEEREKYGQDYVQPSSDNPAGSQGTVKSDNNGHPPAIPTHTKPPSRTTFNNHTPPIPTTTTPTTKADPFPETWTCEICTLNNPQTYLCCDACGTERHSTTTFSPSTQVPRPSPPPPISTPSNSILPAAAPINNKPTSKSKSSLSQPTSRLKPKSSLKNLARFYEAESKKPLGWLCHRCGTFMESEWWTCASCGTVKQSS